MPVSVSSGRLHGSASSALSSLRMWPFLFSSTPTTVESARGFSTPLSPLKSFVEVCYKHKRINIMQAIWINQSLNTIIHTKPALSFGSPSSSMIFAVSFWEKVLLSRRTLDEWRKADAARNFLSKIRHWPRESPTARFLIGQSQRSTTCFDHDICFPSAWPLRDLQQFVRRLSWW